MTKPINVLQFTCPDGFYGAERWIIALAKNLDDAQVNCGLAITVEPEGKGLEIAEHYRNLNKEVYEVAMSNRCLLYTSPSPRDATLSRMPSSA